MKSTGVVRKVDELGRIVIPKELRRTLKIEMKDPIEIFIDNEKIILQKYKPSSACLITGEVNDDNIKMFDGKINLSREGAKRLVQEIEKRQVL